MITETGTLCELAGGPEAVERLAQAFYARVAGDPVLRPIYGQGSLDCATRHLAGFLVQFFGGPDTYSGSRPSLRESHTRFRIGPAERDAWLRDMDGALEDAGIPAGARPPLRLYFARAAGFLTNDSDGSGDTAAHEPEAGETAEEGAALWAGQRSLEELLTAVQGGSITRAIALAESPELRAHGERNTAARLTVLAALGASGAPEALDYVRRRLQEQPELTLARYGDGSTLLHRAAGAWAPAFAALLLEFGADPSAADGFGHAPLYAAGNHQGEPQQAGAEVVRLLAGAGADVNACGGVKRCTALHMAARRGSPEVAAALLECGADLEARDSLGETPLRRAVNCGKPPMVAFLLQRGADPHASGSRNLTPAQAARGSEIRRLFETRG